MTASPDNPLRSYRTFANRTHIVGGHSRVRTDWGRRRSASSEVAWRRFAMKFSLVAEFSRVPAYATVSNALPRVIGFALSAIAICPTGGCSVNQYAGIPFASGAASVELQNVALRAATGDKHALLALGIAYEEGQIVAKDLNRAKRLYAAAAKSTGGTRYIHTPIIPGVAPSQVRAINNGPLQRGLIDAKRRLDRLDGDNE